MNASDDEDEDPIVPLTDIHILEEDEGVYLDLWPLQTIILLTDLVTLAEQTVSLSWA